MSQHKIRRARLFVPLLLLALVAAACGAETEAGGAEAGGTEAGGTEAEGTEGDGELSLGISAPEDGAEVAETFTVEFDASVPVGDPSTGNHHVHLCVDSDCVTESEYELVYDTTFELSGLSPGEHVISASLRNADHSDAGPNDEIAVVVGGDDGATGGGPATGDVPATDGGTDTTSPGIDYDY